MVPVGSGAYSARSSIRFLGWIDMMLQILHDISYVVADYDLDGL